MKNHANTIRAEANALIEDAKNELVSKSDYDAQRSCMNCKHAMIKYLNAYLIERKVIPNELQTMSALLRQCKNIDHTFEVVDLSSIDCRFEKINEDHCTDHTDLQHCLEVVTNVKHITSLE